MWCNATNSSDCACGLHTMLISFCLASAIYVTTNTVGNQQQQTTHRKLQKGNDGCNSENRLFQTHFRMTFFIAFVRRIRRFICFRLYVASHINCSVLWYWRSLTYFRSYLHQSSCKDAHEVKAYPVDVRRRGRGEVRVEITKRSCCRLRGRDRFWLGLCLSCLTQGCRGWYEFCARLILAIKSWVITQSLSGRLAFVFF